MEFLFKKIIDRLQTEDGVSEISYALDYDEDDLNKRFLRFMDESSKYVVTSGVLKKIEAEFEKSIYKNPLYSFTKDKEPFFLNEALRYINEINFPHEQMWIEFPNGSCYFLFEQDINNIYMSTIKDRDKERDSLSFFSTFFNKSYVQHTLNDLSRDEESKIDNTQMAKGLLYTYILFNKLYKRTAFGKGDFSVPVKKMTSKGRVKTRKTVQTVHIVKLWQEELDTVHKPVNKKEIDWSHSWEVSGHWRLFYTEENIRREIDFNKKGKNRRGEYKESGRTWVLPHVKGKGELKVKTKVMIDSSPSTPQYNPWV